MVYGIHNEEKEINPMENDKERVSALNNKLNPAAPRPQEERKANCKNADNHDPSTYSRRCPESCG